jgi:hypothetical protein
MFWEPEALASMLRLDAVPVTSGRGVVDLQSLNVVCDIFDERGDRPLLRLSCEHRAIWLELGDGDPMAGAFLPRFIIEGTHRLSAQLMTLKRITALTRTGGLAPSLFLPPRRAARFVALLRTVDGRAAGASHRDIAAALFGAERTETDWNAASDFLRSRTKRIIASANLMVDRGYLKLLGHGAVP